MSANSKIEWTTHTFNAWRGCTKVSDGCKNCYAETQSKRNPKVLGIWGDAGTRVVAAESYWRQPVKWNRDAECSELSERPRVFALSLGDWLEDRPDLVAPLARLLAVVNDTPELDWLLLTKRPENWRRRITAAADLIREGGSAWATVRLLNVLMMWLDGHAPPNVWLGTSIEDQRTADERIPHLLKCPAAVRFVSAEPLLGPVKIELRRMTTYHMEVSVSGAIRNRSFDGFTDDDGAPLSREQAEHRLVQLRDQGIALIPMAACLGFSPKSGCPGHRKPGIDWVIVGGESGPNARPSRLEWQLSVVEQCRAAGVPVFWKQWGSRVRLGYYHEHDTLRERLLDMRHKIIVPTRDGGVYEHDARFDGQPPIESLIEAYPGGKGGDWSEWPEDLRVREMPQ